MTSAAALQVTTPTDREVVVTRGFDAPEGCCLTRTPEPPSSSAGCSAHPGGRCPYARSTFASAANIATSGKAPAASEWVWRGQLSESVRRRGPGETPHLIEGGSAGRRAWPPRAPAHRGTGTPLPPCA